MNRIPAAPLLFRAAVPIGAVLVVVAGGRVADAPFAALVAGVVLALVRPARFGAWLAVPAAVWSFVSATAADVGEGPTLLAAAGIYLIHTGTAAAAALPLTARVDVGVVRRWLVRCLPAVVVTAAVAGVDATLGESPDSPLFLTATGLLVVVAVVSLVRLLAATREA